MDMDLSFIGKPHSWDPRRLYSQTGVDWQQRVDFDRLHKERLARVREQMEAHDVGALVLFAGANIRYVTGSYQGNWKYNINIRYAVVPNNGEPILFETAGLYAPTPPKSFDPAASRGIIAIKRLRRYLAPVEIGLANAERFAVG